MVTHLFFYIKQGGDKMISNTTKVVNNKFQVTFNFAPKDIVHSRTNSKGTYTATHKGGGTTQRKGI